MLAQFMHTQSWRNNKTPWKCRCILMFLVFAVSLGVVVPTRVFAEAEKKPMGAECENTVTNSDCITDECESGDLGKNYCVCNVYQDCVTAYGGEKGERWQCLDGDDGTYNYNVCYNGKSKILAHEKYELKQKGMKGDMDRMRSNIPKETGPLSAAAGLIFSVLAKIFLWLANLMVGLMSVFITLMMVVGSYNDFINGPGVVVGWTLIRDVINMFFIVLLLLIAFATMLNFEKYHLKKTLPRLLIIAVAVNFSRLLLGIVIDFAQVVMMTFMNAIQQVGAGNFLQAFHMHDMFNFSNLPGGAKGLEYLMAAILVFALLAMATVVIGTITIMLVLRMIALWMLIVLSPLAFFLWIIPEGGMFKKYHDEWRSKFRANVVLGPVLVFFVWLGLAMAGDGKIYEKIGGSPSQELGAAAGAGSQVGFLGEAGGGIAASSISTIQNLSGFILALAVFLFAIEISQDLAKETGVSAMSSVAKKGGEWAKGAAKLASGYSTAGRMVSPAWDRGKKLWADTAPGTKTGKKLERGVLAAAAKLPGDRGEQAKEQLMAERAQLSETQKKRHESKSTKDIRNAISKGHKNSGEMALILAERGEKLTDKEHGAAERAFAGNDVMRAKFTGALKKTQPELAYDLSDEAEVDKMFREGNAENLSLETVASPMGDAIMARSVSGRGVRATGKWLSGIKDPAAKRAAYNKLAETQIPRAVDRADVAKGKFKKIETDLASAKKIATALDRADMSVANQERVRRADRDVATYTKQQADAKRDMTDVNQMIQMHVKETGDPVAAVAGVKDPRKRQNVLREAFEKSTIKAGDLEADGVGSAEVLVAAHQGLGSKQYAKFIDKLDPATKKKAKATAGAIDSASATTSKEEALVKIATTGSFKGVDARDDSADVMRESVHSMSRKQIAEVDLESLGGAEDEFYDAIISKPNVIKGLNKEDISNAVLIEMKAKIKARAAAAPPGEDTSSAVSEVNAWKIEVDVANSGETPPEPPEISSDSDSESETPPTPAIPSDGQIVRYTSKGGETKNYTVVGTTDKGGVQMREAGTKRQIAVDSEESVARIEVVKGGRGGESGYSVGQEVVYTTSKGKKGLYSVTGASQDKSGGIMIEPVGGGTPIAVGGAGFERIKKVIEEESAKGDEEKDGEEGHEGGSK